jgi:hypothetical protein
MILSVGQQRQWPMELDKCVDESTSIEEANKAFQRLPAKISPDQGHLLQETAQQYVVGSLDQYYPEVFISYATGNRKEAGDFPGFGPGTYYTLVLIKLLSLFGIPCFSGLMVPPGTNWETFLVKLGSRFSKCKLLIVVQTPAFYRSFPCLEEVFQAASHKKKVDGEKKKIKLLPIRFEDQLPDVDDQWDQIEEHDTNKLLWLQKVQDTLGKINSIPSPPSTVISSPDALWQIVDMVHEALDKQIHFVGEDGEGSCPAASSSVMAKRYSDKARDGHHSVEKLPDLKEEQLSAPEEAPKKRDAEPEPQDPSASVIGKEVTKPSDVPILVDL